VPDAAGEQAANLDPVDSSNSTAAADDAAEARLSAAHASRTDDDADEVALDPELLSWVRHAQAGDRLAFARLHRQWAPVVRGLLISHVPPQEAADLLQEVFLAVLEHLPELEEPERFAPWLAAIARNRARDWLRRGGVRATSVGLEHAPEPVDERRPEASGESSDESERALAMIRSLPEAYRETLVLRLVEGLSGKEISKRTGLTHGSVRVNLHRGMRLLRAALQEVRR
jgi:RNA polymerase sigma-70 factor (ECF subfamily)